MGHAMDLGSLPVKINKEIVDSFLCQIFDQLEKEGVKKVSISVNDTPIFADKYVVGTTEQNFFYHLKERAEVAKIAVVVEPKYTSIQTNAIPKQIQWNENNGYCGETSLGGSGLFFGQYLSQYDIRAAGNRTGSQETQVLLGTAPELNADTAAKKLSLTYALSNDAGPSVNKNPKDFLAWVKNQVLKGIPVAIGVYENMKWFGASNGSSEGYDHIVTITGIGSNHPLKKDGTDVYYDDDVIYIDDHGLWTGDTDVNGYSSSTFKDFQKTRKQANSDNSSANVYSLPTDCDNYGIAITGIEDTLKETIPLRVDILSSNYPTTELPEIVEGSSVRPLRSNAIDLQITASGLKPSVQYNVYKYVDITKVPSKNFNANSQGQLFAQISSVNSIFKDTITADPNTPPVAIYRAVEASGP